LWTRAQKEAAARFAFGLLFCTWGLNGCGPAAVPSPHFVRLEALLPFHPLWPEVEDIEQKLNSRPPVAHLKPIAAAVGFPTPFRPPAFAARPLEARQRRPLASYARASLDRLVENLRKRHAEALTRIQRKEQRQIEREIATRRLEYEASASAAIARQIRQLDRQIETLGFQEVIYLSRIRVYNDRAYLDAVRERDRVRAEIDRLTQERDALLARVRPQVDQAVAQEQRRLEAVLETKLRQIRAEQLQAEQKLIAAIEERRQRRRQIARPETERISVARLAVPPENTLEPLRRSVLLTKAQAAIFPQRKAVAQEAENWKRGWEAQRQLLLNTIRKDTRQTLAKIARSEGWTLIEAKEGDPIPTGNDRTEAAAQALRAVWSARSLELRR
jgi:hypothetical protein